MNPEAKNEKKSMKQQKNDSMISQLFFPSL
jgi:hypothetical protein